MKLHRFDMKNEGLSDPPMIVERADGDYCDADDAMEIIEKLESELEIIKKHKKLASFCAAEPDGYFEVMLNKGEYEWEQMCGPYNTYANAEKAMLEWSESEKSYYMCIAKFFSPKTGANDDKSSMG